MLHCIIYSREIIIFEGIMITEWIIVHGYIGKNVDLVSFKRNVVFPFFSLMRLVSGLIPFLE